MLGIAKKVLKGERSVWSVISLWPRKRDGKLLDIGQKVFSTQNLLERNVHTAQGRFPVARIAMKPVFRTWAKSVFCTYLNNYFPWWKKLYSYLGHLDFLSRIPFPPSGKALALKSYPRKKKKASAVRNYYFFRTSFLQKHTGRIYSYKTEFQWNGTTDVDRVKLCQCRA